MHVEWCDGVAVDVSNARMAEESLVQQALHIPSATLLAAVSHQQHHRKAHRSPRQTEGEEAKEE